MTPMPQCPICHTEYEFLPENKICFKCSECPSTSTSIGMEQYKELAESSGRNFRINQLLEDDGDLEIANQEDQSDENDDNRTASEAESSAGKTFCSTEDKPELSEKEQADDVAGEDDSISKLEEKSEVLIKSLKYFSLLFIEYIEDNEKKIEDNEKKMDAILKELSELKNKIEKQLSPLVINESLVNNSDSESLDDLNLPPKTVPISEPAKPDLVTSNQSTTSLIIIDSTEQKIITSYNVNPKNFQQSSSALEVGITEQTISNERLGSQRKIIFKNETRGTYWIFKNSVCLYLLINKNIKIDQYKSNYIKKVFDCYKEKDNQDYNNFKLLKPAQVSKLNQGGEFFQLEQKGILEFY